MWSFNTFKDIRYWILLVPFLIILVLYIYCTPSNFFEKPYVSSFSIFIFPALFWSIYYLWNYLDGKKKRKNRGSNSDL